MECSRCHQERAVTCLYKPRGHSFVPKAAAEAKLEKVCGDCLTDEEIASKLGPVVEFSLSVLSKSIAQGNADDEALRALEIARCFFAVVNLGAPNRAIAQKAAILL